MKEWKIGSITVSRNVKGFSCTKIAGAPRKISKGWETKVAHIIARVSKVQIAQQKYNIIVPKVKDDNMCNTDHVPVYIYTAGNSSWGEKNLEEGRLLLEGKKKNELQFS